MRLRIFGAARPAALAAGALGGGLLLGGVFPCAGQQPADLPAVAAQVAGTPNPDGTFHVTYRFPAPARGQLAGWPVVRVHSAKGELVALLPLLIFRQGNGFSGFGNFRLPRRPGDGPYRVQVEVPFVRADGSKALVVAAQALARP